MLEQSLSHHVVGQAVKHSKHMASVSGQTWVRLLQTGMLCLKPGRADHLTQQPG